MRLSTVCVVLSLATIATVANAQGTKPVGQVAKEPVSASGCEVLARQRRWLNAGDMVAWIQACKDGWVNLADLRISHETLSGEFESAFVSANVTAAGPLVDTESIRVTFKVGPSSFPAAGSGTGLRVTDVYFTDPCAQNVPVNAVASWRTKPVGTPARPVELSKTITTSYYHLNPPVTPVILPSLDASGYASFRSVMDDQIQVLNYSPGRTYTLTKAEFFCQGTDGGWRPCQPGDAWALLDASTALPAALTCGQSVSFHVQPSVQFAALLAIFSYTESFNLNAVSSVFVYWEWPSG